MWLIISDDDGRGFGCDRFATIDQILAWLPSVFEELRVSVKDWLEHAEMGDVCFLTHYNANTVIVAIKEEQEFVAKTLFKKE